MSQSPQAPLRSPRSANLVRNVGGSDWTAPVDWSRWYLTDEEDMGQSGEQDDVTGYVKPSLEFLAEERGWQDAHVGSDVFFGWVREHPLVRVSPDVFLMRGCPPPPPLPDSWQMWKPGHRPPKVAFEFVSQDWKKDYEENPEKYAQLGAEELVIFDPAAVGRPARGRMPIQVFRRTADGAFVATHCGPGPAYSETLEIWLVIARERFGPRLRLARDAEGRRLVPTHKEAEQQARQAEQQARQAQQQAEAELERERAQRASAQSDLAALRAEIERLRGSTPPTG